VDGVERRSRHSWVATHLLARGGKGNVGTHCPMAQVASPPASVLPATVVLVAGMTVARWAGAACRCPQQPRGPVSGGLSHTPQPLGHVARAGVIWGQRAAGSAPSRGAGCPMAPKGRCLTSSVWRVWTGQG